MAEVKDVQGCVVCSLKDYSACFVLFSVVCLREFKITQSVRAMEDMIGVDMNFFDHQGGGMSSPTLMSQPSNYHVNRF